MKTKGINFLVLSVLITIGRRAGAQILYDNFGGNLINSSIWTTSLPYADSSVTEGGGVVSLENNGRLTTAISMPTSYQVTGSFLETANANDDFKVVLRSDGVPYGTTPSVPTEAKGIAIQFQVETDTGDTSENLRIFTIGDPSGDATTPYASANLTLNTWNTFRITDDGYNVDLYFNGASTPNLTFQSSFSQGDLITMYNREGADGGSAISNDGITELNSFEVIPEPSSVALFSLGGLAFMAFKKGSKEASKGSCVFTPLFNSADNFQSDSLFLRG